MTAFGLSYTVIIHYGNFMPRIIKIAACVTK